MGCFTFTRIKTCDSDSEIGRRDPGSTTWILNETSETLVLRDKYRQQFGRLRHEVAPHTLKEVEVDLVGVDTYYQMGVLVRPSSPAANAVAGAECSNGTALDLREGNTHLCIDTDDLMVYSKIIVSCSGEKYYVNKIQRDRSPA